MLAAWGCSDNRTDTKDLLVRIDDYALTKRQLEEDMPAGLTAEEREDFARQYIEKWVSSVLLYDVARKNLSDVHHLVRLVEDYRREFFFFLYLREPDEVTVGREVSRKSIKTDLLRNRRGFSFHKHNSVEYVL